MFINKILKYYSQIGGTGAQISGIFQYFSSVKKVRFKRKKGMLSPQGLNAFYRDFTSNRIHYSTKNAVLAPLKTKITLREASSKLQYLYDEARYSKNKTVWNALAAVILFNLTAWWLTAANQKSALF